MAMSVVSDMSVVSPCKGHICYVGTVYYVCYVC